MSIETMRQALEALELALSSHGVMLLSDPPQDAWKTRQVESKSREAITALRAAIEQAEKQDQDVYGYARNLADAVWQKHYKAIAPNWKPLDDLIGVLVQIDNMIAWLTAPSTVPQQWVGLTDEEIAEIWRDDYKWENEYFDLPRAVEAKLKEKNDG